MAVLDAATVREYLPSLTGTGEDTALDSLIARFGALAAQYLGYQPASVGGNPTVEDTTYTLYLDGDGSKYLQLPITPVVSVTSLHVDIDRKYGSDRLVDSGDYELFGDEGLVLLKVDSTQGEWDRGKRTVKAVVVAGFTTIPMPISTPAPCRWHSGGWHAPTLGKPVSAKAVAAAVWPPSSYCPRCVRRSNRTAYHPACWGEAWLTRH